MLGTRIVVNEEKIIKEGLYDLDEFYRVIDENAKLNNLIKTDKCTYMAKGDENDLANVGIFCRLKHRDWFTQNIKEWYWLDDGDGDVDLIKRYNMHEKRA